LAKYVPATGPLNEGTEVYVRSHGVGTVRLRASFLRCVHDCMNK